MLHWQGNLNLYERSYSMSNAVAGNNITMQSPLFRPPSMYSIWKMVVQHIFHCSNFLLGISSFGVMNYFTWSTRLPVLKLKNSAFAPYILFCPCNPFSENSMNSKRRNVLLVLFSTKIVVGLQAWLIYQMTPTLFMYFLSHKAYHFKSLEWGFTYCPDDSKYISKEARPLIITVEQKSTINLLEFLD